MMLQFSSRFDFAYVGAQWALFGYAVLVHVTFWQFTTAPVKKSYVTGLCIIIMVPCVTVYAHGMQSDGKNVQQRTANSMHQKMQQ